MAEITIYHNVSGLHRNGEGKTCGLFFGTCGRCRLVVAYRYQTTRAGPFGYAELAETYRENQAADSGGVNARFGRRSLSAGDVIEVEGQQWAVGWFGFREIRLHPNQITVNPDPNLPTAPGAGYDPEN